MDTPLAPQAAARRIIPCACCGRTRWIQSDPLTAPGHYICFRGPRRCRCKDAKPLQGCQVKPQFEYEVRLAVSLPSAWTTLLKKIASHHYDYKCREAGDRGVINGLHNTTCDGEFPSSFRVTWRDLDLITKVMEQAHYHQEVDVVGAIRQWLHEAKTAIEGRHAAITAHFDQEAP